MSTIAYTVENAKPGVRVVTWASMGVNDVGVGFVSAMYADKTIQAYSGAWNSSTVVVEGTNETSNPSNWEHLHKVDTSTMTLSDVAGDRLEQILENPYQIRPRISGGTGSITVKLLVATPMEYNRAE